MRGYKSTGLTFRGNPFKCQANMKRKFGKFFRFPGIL